MEADFSGYATVANLKCSDGRTIAPAAFKHMDKQVVPLIWSHGHDSPTNILGHAILEWRSDGVYTYGFFNDTPNGQHAKAMVKHKDVTRLSIYANQLKEEAKRVLHGMIREVSLVIAGANSGAKIDNVKLQHGEGDDVWYEDLAGDLIIHSGLDIVLEDDDDALAHAQSLQEIYDTMTDDQKGFVQYVVGVAAEQPAQAAAHSDDNKTADNNTAEGDKNDEGDLNHQEGTTVSRNVFDQNGGKGKSTAGGQNELSHDDMKSIMTAAKRPGATLKSAMTDYALQHGITNLDVLFPDAQTIDGRPEFISRRMEWVAGVLDGTHHTPFSRIKTIWADITQEQARALGYIKGTYKKEEWFALGKRITTPATVIKKQMLDRDDIVDITDMDVVPWMKAEMQVMIKEEIARAILIGDGRDPSDPDKVKDPGGSNSEGAGIRAIINDHELFMTTVNVQLTATPNYLEVTEAALRARRFYKGSGSPTFYTTAITVAEMLLTKDDFGQYRWKSRAELANALMVREIVEVEVMETMPDVLGIMVNLADYNIGTDKGGELTMFDDFDIDFNQFKYLIDARLSGALTKIKSALVFKKVLVTTDTLVTPTVPTFNKLTGVVTIPAKTGVVYKNETTNATLTAGAQTALALGATLKVIAVPASTYFFATNGDDQWSFTRPAA